MGFRPTRPAERSSTTSNRLHGYRARREHDEPKQMLVEVVRELRETGTPVTLKNVMAQCEMPRAAIKR